MTQTALVIGSTGYLGRAMIQALLNMPDTAVFGMSRHPNSALDASQALQEDLLGCDWHSILEKIKPDVIYHFAGSPKASPFPYHVLIHADGTRRLLQAIADSDDYRPHVLIAGSAAEYGLQPNAVRETDDCQPEGDYGIAKLTQTQVALRYIRQANLPVTIGRIFNVYGETEGDLAVASLASQLAGAEARAPWPTRMKAHNLQSQRDFIHIDDVVNAFIALSQHSPIGASNRIYNIASGEATPLFKVMESLLAHTRMNDFELRQVDVELVGPQTEDISVADISHITQDILWTPSVSLNEGLKRELKYWRAVLENQPKMPSQNTFGSSKSNAPNSGDSGIVFAG